MTWKSKGLYWKIEWDYERSDVRRLARARAHFIVLLCQRVPNPYVWQHSLVFPPPVMTTVTTLTSASLYIFGTIIIIIIIIIIINSLK